METTWLDRTIAFFAPQAALRRQRARLAAELLARHYESASYGRRTQGWNRGGGDANAVAGPALATLRNSARDLVRNNGYAESALTTISDHVVGWGITAKPTTKSPRVADAWKKWAETTACDADGRNNLYGLQHLVMRTVVESGEVLVRRRFRRPEDGLPIPLQLQVLDPDFIDTSLSSTTYDRTGKIVVSRVVQGVEFDVFGKRSAYWLFPEHPGSDMLGGMGAARRIPAESILHIYKHGRPGQVRGVSWFAPVLMTFRDFDEFADATLMKAKVAACLAVLTSDADGTGPPLGSTDTTQDPMVDSLEPGMILNLPPGRSISVVQPSSTADYPDFSRTTLRAIATGLGVAYEDLAGDYTNLPFSAARMSRIRSWARVEDWRWRMLIPQLCDPVWAWAMEAAQIMGIAGATAPTAEWTAPPAPMIDPANEGLAYQRRIRNGLLSQSEAIRELGYDPETVLAEIAADNDRLDALGIILDSDPRKTTQAGNPTAAIGGASASPAEPDMPADMPAKKKPNGAADPDAEADAVDA